jgi:cytochrome c553
MNILLRLAHPWFTNYTLLLSITLWSLTAHAVGDAEAGKAKADTCYGCHAVPNYSNAYPAYHVPKLAGQRPEYIVEALKAYKSGSRKHGTMHANAANLSTQDMEDIAAYISQPE